MNVILTELPGVVILEPRVFEDARGFLFESFNKRQFGEVGLPTEFVQDNHSRSVPGSLRGLHYQLRAPQGKLVRCVRGAVFDVAADIRRGSPTFGRWVGVELSADNRRQLFIPPGYAHGFCVPAVESDVVYKCTALYDAADGHGIAWNDPLLSIAWPVLTPLLSPKDAQYPRLLPDRDDLPAYQGPIVPNAG
jgi:dTDP-4-dehydrorhamnose 3,5-epimerase